jgi:hypothetical protein
MVVDMSRRRIWTPFVVAFLAGTLLIFLERPVGEFLNLYNPLMGYAAVDVWAGLPIGFLAAAASRTWRGLLTLVLGFATAGAVSGAVSAVQGSADPVNSILLGAPYMALLLGLLGVPTYAVVVSAVYVIRRLRRPGSPERIEAGEPDEPVG